LAAVVAVVPPEAVVADDEDVEEEEEEGFDAPDAEADAGGASRPAERGGLVTSAGCVTTVGGTGARAAIR
jgi:hypothetical protein